ncbi:GMP synthase [Colwelliaceae bacterium MEBiC 14330]
MKLGLLLCDHVSDSLQPEFGDYSDMFARAIAAVDASITITIYAVVDGHFPVTIDECDAYLITGSKESVNDGLPWIQQLEKFVWQLFLCKKNLVGICFGHQMIAKALGGRVHISPKDWGIGVTRAKVHLHKPWMLDEQTHIQLVVSHKEQISLLPPETQVLMGNDFCPYGMIQVEKHFLGIQGHPEFSRAYCYALMQKRKDFIAKRNFTRGIHSLSLTVDDKLLMSWLINFLRLN